jgi:hypothetical protein
MFREQISFVGRANDGIFKVVKIGLKPAVQPSADNSTLLLFSNWCKYE